MYLELKAKDKRQAIMMYLQILDGFHKMTDKEMQTFAEIILIYTDLKFKYDAEIAGKLFLSTENRASIRESLGMEDSVFRNYLVKFRQKGFLLDNGIKELFTPDYSKAIIEIHIGYDKG